MLRETLAASTAWHALDAQFVPATRRSPGLINLTYSRLSRSSRLLVRSGLAPVVLPSRFHSSGNRGCTCASLLTRSISFGSSVVFKAAGFPPWQAVQLSPNASLPSFSCSNVSVVPYLCIGSILPWHETQPSIFGVGAVAGVWPIDEGNLRTTGRV